MKRLTLMRHANAQWKDPQTADFERPLNRRGMAETQAMARRLLELKLIPDLLVASSARRTQQTADIVARELELPARHVQFDEALYLARAQGILKVTHTTGPRVGHLMIIGHNPGMSELARLLAPEHCAGELATAAMCSITFDVTGWPAVTAENAADVQCESPPSRLFSLWA